MKEHDITAALKRVAESDVPANVDLWPALRQRLAPRPARRLSPVLTLAASGALVLALVFGAYRLAHHPGSATPAPTQLADQPAGSSASWVVPEVFPDLDTLAAASELIVRAQVIDGNRLSVAEVLANRLNVDPAAVRLELLKLPPDAPALLNDTVPEPGQEYVLFLRSFYGANSEQFKGGDRTFGVVGGPQGMWRIAGGTIVQSADVPLKARNGQALAEFVAAVKAAPDVRAACSALLQKYGWAAGEPDAVRLQAVPAATALQRDAELQAWLAVSRASGLDWSAIAGQQALWLRYDLGNGVNATVLVANGKPTGAWLRAGERGLVFGIEQRDQALTAAVNPALRPTATPDPNPIGARPNLAQHYRLGEASSAWVKGGPVRGGLVRDGALRQQLAKALSVEVAVEHVDEIPADDAQTVLIAFAVGEETVAFRYHLDRGKVYEATKGVAFAPPDALLAVLKPLLGQAPTVAPAGQAPVPTTAPAGLPEATPVTLID